MKVFFNVIFLLLFLSANPCPAEEQIASAASPEQKKEAVDLNAPAPASPLKIKLPRSERTRENILDTALDFLFVRLFKNIKNMEFSYDFFEIDGNFDLHFKNFKVKLSRPNIQGTIEISKFSAAFSEFMNAIKSQQLLLSDVKLENLTADLRLIRKDKTEAENEKEEAKKENPARNLKISAQKIALKNLSFLSWKNAKEEKKDKNILIGELMAENAALSLSDPNEKYGAKKVVVKDISASEYNIRDLEFSFAEVNGKKQNNREELFKALKR